MRRSKAAKPGQHEHAGSTQRLFWRFPAKKYPRSFISGNAPKAGLKKAPILGLDGDPMRQHTADSTTQEPMNFGSDNAYGALPQVLAAVMENQTGTQPPYGNDAVTKRLGEVFGKLFEREVAVFPVLTGTAANALALASLVPPHGAVLCHEEAHILTSECGAPEFFAGGARLVGIAGADGKLTPEGLATILSNMDRGNVHAVQPFAISLSQASELGTAYSRRELKAIGAFARAEGLKLHMDGARFANAMAHLKCSPAEATWKCGVDVLCFGASKAGAMAAEAVVFFNPADARDFEYRRKRTGHLVSKMRLVSAQLEAIVKDDLWLKAATHANALATRIAAGIKSAPGIRIAAPVETNMVFAEMPVEAAAHVRAGGAIFYEWGAPANGRVLIRLATSFATPDAHVARLIELLNAES